VPTSMVIGSTWGELGLGVGVGVGLGLQGCRCGMREVLDGVGSTHRGLGLGLGLGLGRVRS
jgi:hypothetical protein